MKKLLFLISLSLLLCLSMAQAADLTAMQIVERANQVAYYAGDDGRSDVQMTIFSANGTTRNREFTMLRKNLAGGDQKFYVYFRAPADVYEMAYLVWKNQARPDDRWLWLPALNLKKRIAPGDKRTSFVGSDFYYEDVSGRGIEEDNHELVEEMPDYYLIKSTPKQPGEVDFAYFQTKIDKESFLPLKAEYFDAGGKPYRVVEALEIKNIQGFPTVMVAEARDLRADTRTRNEFTKVAYDVGLDERIFTERFLRRPPREVR